MTGTQLGSYGCDLQEDWPGAGLTGLIRRVLGGDQPRPAPGLVAASPRNNPGTAGPVGISPVVSPLPHTAPERQRRHIEGDAPPLRCRPFCLRRRTDSAHRCGCRRDHRHNRWLPGEGAHEFEEGLELARSMAFSDIHAFPYSARPGTSAAHFRETVGEETKRDRMGQMLALAAEFHRKFREGQLGTVRKCAVGAAADRRQRVDRPHR